MQAQTVCGWCGSKFLKDKKHITYAANHGNKLYCSKSCISQSRYRGGKLIPCAACGKLVYRMPSDFKRSQSGNVFCNRSCATIFNNTKFKSGINNSNFVDGHTSYRPKAFSSLISKCHFCEYDNEKVLQVHHIDGNKLNNKITNLVIVCPTHHVEIHRGIRTM
jgi:hypothetical protein